VIENVYRLQVMNTDAVARRYSIEANGLPGLAVVGVAQPVALDAEGAKLVPLRVRVAADAAAPGTHRIEFVVTALEDATVARREPSTFILPRP
jgi:hypothetical protein